MSAPVATTAGASAATAQYYAEQNRIAAGVAQLILARWLFTVDPDNIAGSSKGWVDEAVAAILRGRQQSVQLASAYLTAVRKMEIPGAKPITIPRPPDPPRQQLEESLIFTGPKHLAISLAKTPEVPPPAPGAPQVEVDRAKRSQESIKVVREKAFQTAGALAAASAYKNVQYGGRDVTDETFHQDSKVEAWIRVTSTSPCGFCLMLASRGPVYRSDSFADSDPRFNGPGNWKAHDGCGCTGKLAWRTGEDGGWTPLARQAEELWISSGAASKSGKDAVNAFRAAAREQGIADLTRW